MIASQTWTWDDFSGWEADGFKKGPQGSVRVTENVDVRSDDGGFRLSQAFTEVGGYEGDVTATSSVYTLSSPNSPAYATYSGTTGKVYVGNTYKFTMGDTLSAYNKVLAFAWMSYTGSWAGYYPYGVSSVNAWLFRLHRFSQNYSGASYGVATWTLPFGRTTWVSSAHLIIGNDELIVAIGNGVYSLSQVEVLTSVLQFPENVNIVGITRFQDSYRIYFNEGLSGQDSGDSYIGYWDGNSASLSSVARYENTKILSVVGGDAYDYVTHGNESSGDLYVVWGLVRTPIRVTPYYSTANSRGFTWGGVMRDGILYLPGKNKNGNYGIYTQGGFFRSQNEGLNCETISSSTCGSNKKVSALAFKRDVEYVWIDEAASADNGKLYSTTISYNGIPVTSGSVITLPFYGLGAQTEKKLEKVRVSYDMGQTWNSISVYARVDANDRTSNSSGFVLLWTFSDVNKKSDFVLAKEINSVLSSNWNSIEFKILLSQPSNQITPTFRSLEIEYTDNLNN